METKTVRLFGAGAVIVVAVVLLVVLKRNGDDEDSAGAGVPKIVIRGGKPVGGVRALSYNAGDQVHFEVESDVSDEVHVHGYGLTKDVAAGGTVEFDFPAGIEGVFEAELEGQEEEIAELRVNP